MKKRVLMYFNSLQPAGGIERVIATLSNRLSDKYDITILVKDKAVSFYKLNDNISFFALDNELRFNMSSKLSRVFSAFTSVVKNYSALNSFLKGRDFDYYYLAHPLNVLEFALIKGIDKNKVVITEHGSQTAYNSIYRTIKKIFYAKCKTYVVPTTADTVLYKNLGFPAKYVPHFRSELPYQKAKKENNILLTIGRFTEVKQQISLLKVWNNIVHQENIHDWKLQLVGSGELAQDFIDFIEANKLQDYVEILPPVAHVEEYFLNASVFALTSSSEGFGMVLLEAISFGLPCVTYDCPSGPRDIIKNGVNGYLVALDDLKNLESSILALIVDQSLRNNMGDHAFQSSEDWNDARILESWCNILD